MMPRTCSGLVVVLLSCPVLAQQVKFIDLTATTQRVELRHMPALPVKEDCRTTDAGILCQGGSTGGAMGLNADCGVDVRDPHWLTVSLESVIGRGAGTGAAVEAEFKIMNTGNVDLELPVSPHLADLQPEDASVGFRYTSLDLSLSPDEDRSVSGIVGLYGRHEIAGTTMMLKPGEWVRVEAMMKFDAKPLPKGWLHMTAGYGMHEVRITPGPGANATDSYGICWNSKQSSSVPLRRDQ